MLYWYITVESGVYISFESEICTDICNLKYFESETFTDSHNYMCNSI